ncbi:MAG: hypothetical protein QOE70_4086 [Chthoniobacter sp.]|nr:hypothetical protein [Chthoniobacter sp.]
MSFPLCKTLRRLWPVLPALAAAWSCALHAEPVAELSAFSVFKNVDVNKLADGKAMMARGPTMNFARGLAIESCYVVRKPLAKTLDLHLRWNPLRHPELKVFLHGDLSTKPAPDEFRKLGGAPANSAVKSFVAATQKIEGGATELQMSLAEAKAFNKEAAGPAGGSIPAAVSAFWINLLQQRASTFLANGLGRLPPYETTGEAVRPGDEIARLLKEAGKVRGQFTAIIDATPLGGGKGSLTPKPYWELFDVEGQAAACLGAVYSRPAGAAVQMVDAQYYCSKGFYALVSLYQLWPITVAGQDATLVWRGDLISAHELGELRGVERMGSGSAMMRATQKAIDSLQRDAADAK